MSYTWETNRDADIWHNATFETIEECIEEAKHEGHSLIYIGTIQEYENIIYVDACSVLEDISQIAFDNCGEAAEGWEPYAQSNEDLEELSNDLTKCVIAWLKKHNDMPSFYKITDIKEVRIQEEG